MDFKESKNSTSEILQDRYTRILGYNWASGTFVAQTKKRRLLRLSVWLLVLLILVLGTRYFLTIQIEIPKGVKTVKPDLQEIPSIPELSPLPDYVAFIANTIISEQNDSDKTVLKTDVANDTVNHESRQNADIQDKLLGRKTKVNDVEETQYFIIVKSTKSKDEAIKYAKELGASGYSSEVILSSTIFMVLFLDASVSKMLKEP